MPDEINIEFDVVSLRATMNFLGRMGGFARSQNLMEAMTEWCRLIEDEAKKKVRVKTGALRDTIRHLVVEEGMGIVGKIIAGETGKKSANIAHWMHDGTRGHMVFPVRAQALHWIDPKTGEHCFSKGHFVRGVTPDYFMLEAFRNKKDDGEHLIREAWKRYTEANAK
jgi:hypothetical protein